MTTPELQPEVPQNAEDAPESTEPTPTGKGLRAELEATKAENRELKADKRNDILGDLGLNPETGMGKMLAEKFDAGDVTLDSLVQVATQDYGVVPPVPQAETHPQAQAIHEANARTEALNQQSGTIAPPTPADAIATAEAEGNYEGSLAMKAAQVADWFGPGAPRQ